MGLKKDIRRVVRDGDDELGLDIHPDDVNAVTNHIYRLVRKAVIRGQVRAIRTAALLYERQGHPDAPDVADWLRYFADTLEAGL